jgi:Uma2 family endonuclease
MSSYPVLHGATYADVLATPDDIRAELIDGELYTSPRPAGRHGRTSDILQRRLGRWFDDGDGGPGGWWIVTEPELHAVGTPKAPKLVLIPDIAGWRRDRVPAFPETSGEWVWPDWICEVLSPSNGRLDRMKKMPQYAGQGVQHMWLVDPHERLLEVYRLTDGLWVQLAVFGGDDVVRAEPFEAVELPLGALWLPSATAPGPQS